MLLLQPVVDADWDTANYLQKRGSLCRDHCWLIDVCEHKIGSAHRPNTCSAFIERFGMLGVRDGLASEMYDYAVHTVLGVPLAQVDLAHRDRNIYVVLHAKKEAVWADPATNWATAIGVKKGSKWFLIPIAY